MLLHFAYSRAALASVRLSFLWLIPWLDRYLSLGVGLSVSVSLRLGSSLLLGFSLSRGFWRLRLCGGHVLG